MMRPGTNEPLNAHYAMGNYILMPQMAVPGQPGAPAVTTAQTASPTATAASTTTGNQQMGQAQYQRQFQQYQHIQAPMGQQLILPQMNAFHMQQFPLLQGKTLFLYKNKKGE